MGSVSRVFDFEYDGGYLQRIVVYKYSMRVRMFFACYLYICVFVCGGVCMYVAGAL